jgi:hypothetical protein
MRRAVVVASAVAISWLPGLLGAQESGPLVVTPNGELPLRSAPPGLFSGRGGEIGAVEPGQSYIVLQRKAVPSIFGTQEWLKVQQISPEAGTAGWAFSGVGGDMQNFSVQPADKLQFMGPTK